MANRDGNGGGLFCLFLVLDINASREYTGATAQDKPVMFTILLETCNGEAGGHGISTIDGSGQSVAD